jgi:sugar O-acyltransferase (sialic acid O-acetyltransferase NeuD family)
MMRRLIIVGAGGFGREVLAFATSSPAHQREWVIGGFLDHNPRALEDYGVPFPILGDPENYTPAPNDLFICAVGDPDIKLTLCRSLLARGAEFTSLIHSTALIGDRSQLGRGCILCAYTVVTSDVHMGDFVTVNVHSGIGHDAVIGDGCTLSAFCDVTGHVQLGEGTFMGSHACVLPGVAIGKYARIGAGTAVIRPVDPGATVMGVPARFICNRPIDSMDNSNLTSDATTGKREE